MNSFRRNPLSIPVIASIVAACGFVRLAVPAQAYNLGYTNFGYTLLYPLTNLAYGPYYILNRAMMQNVYSPYGYTPYGGRFSSGNPYSNLNNLSGTQNFSNYTPNGYPGPSQTLSGNYPQQAANFNPQGNYPPPINNLNNNPKSQDPFSPITQPYAPGQASMPQNGLNHNRSTPPNSPQVVAAGGANSNAAAAGPALAPNRFGGEQSQTGGSFAGDFLDVISNKYHGDVGHAFKDDDVRVWAQALNIPIPENDVLEKMGHVRKQAIMSVLKDNSLDTNNKIEALRVLLH
jgi:hypothetical protein